jgi:hypothetical protein
MNMATYIKRHGNPGPNVTYCQGCKRYVPAGLWRARVRRVGLVTLASAATWERVCGSCGTTEK